MSIVTPVQYYLVRNDLGLRCGRCRQVHEYVSVTCLPVPMTAEQEVALLEHQTTEKRGHVHGAPVKIQQDTINGMWMGRAEPISLRDAQMLLIRIRLRGGKV